MMKINNFIKKIIVNLLVILILASCNIDVEWNGKFQDDLGRYIITPVTFFAKDTDIYGQSFDFIIGEKIIASDLPDHKDPKIWELKPGYMNKGWTLKTEDIDFELDYANKADRTIEYFVVPRHSLSFYGSWEPCKDTPYKIEYQLESLESDDVFEYKEFETRYGETDTTVTLSDADIKNYEGFTASTPLPGGTIDGRGTTVFSVQYKRNEISLNFHNMASYDNQQYQVRGKYGRDVLLTEWPVNSKQGYKFYGWTTQAEDEVTKENYDEAIAIIEKEIPKKFPLNYIDYYPVFGPMVYDLTFKDQFGKTISGTFDETKKWTYDGNDLPLDSPSDVDSDVAVFEGWYVNNPNCDNEDSKLSSSGSNWSLPVDKLNGINDVLYAKWNYKKIYVDPENGSDENKGMSPEQALKTIAHAIEYAPEKIMLCSALTDPDDICCLNGFDTSGISIERYSASNVISFPFIHIKAGSQLPEDKKLNNITLDGGADFQSDDNGPYLFTYDSNYSYEEQTTKSRKRNDGVESSTALIINEGIMFIGDSVILRNNLNNSEEGGAIYNTGTLTLSATAGYEIIIENNNSAKYGGGIYHKTINNLTLNNVIIRNNSASSPIIEGKGGDSGQGGGIFINSENLDGNPKITLTNVQILNNRAVTSGGGLASTANAARNRPEIYMTDVKVNHNFVASKNNAKGSGGGIYAIWTNLTITNGNVKDNISGVNGGGITAAQGVPLVCSNVIIENNTAYGNGGGISTTAGSNGVILSDGSKLLNNHLGNETGKGSAVYMANSAITIKNGYIDHNNDVYFTTSNSEVILTDETSLSSDSYAENNGIIALLTPDIYDEGKIIITNKKTSGGNFASLFKVSDSPDGKKWAIKQESENSNGILDCISSDAGGSGIENPLEQTVTASLNGSRIVVKCNGTIVKPDTISISIYYYGTLTDTPLTDTKYADPDSSDSISLPAEYPSGTYDLDVSGTYKGVPFFATLQMTK